MKRWVYALLLLTGLFASAGCLAMTIMAARYLEWGRVLLYGMLLVFSAELSVFAAFRLRKIGKSEKGGNAE